MPISQKSHAGEAIFEDHLSAAGVPAVKELVLQGADYRVLVRY